MKNSDTPTMPTQINGGDLYGGLTKREHFAGLAMQGLIAADSTRRVSYMAIASMSLKHADALLDELDNE